MEDLEVLNFYKPLTIFLSELCGPSCEVVLHDISNTKNSVIDIQNGYLSGRTIGSPLTDLSKNIISSKTYETRDYIANYNGASKGKKFISSTFFIKNKGRLIGLLCVNRDLSASIDLTNLIKRMQRQYNLILDDSSFQENLDVPIDDILEDLIENAFHHLKISRISITKQDRILILQHLQQQGVLTMKGAIAAVAYKLDISIPTVYRYLKK